MKKLIRWFKDRKETKRRRKDKKNRDFLGQYVRDMNELVGWVEKNPGKAKKFGLK